MEMNVEVSNANAVVNEEVTYIVHRNGTREEVSFDKIRDHIRFLSQFPSKLKVDYIAITATVCNNVVAGITTSQLNELAAETAAAKVAIHPDYALLAGRIAVANYHKRTPDNFSDTITQLYNCVDERTNEKSPQISDEVYLFVMNNMAILNNAIVNQRDFDIDYFGFKTLEKTYLRKVNGVHIERPQQMYMRVAIGIHISVIDKSVSSTDITAVIDTYNMLSKGDIMSATPTLFNSGTVNGQLASCYLVDTCDDSIKAITETMKICAVISKNAGGIGINCNKIRAENAYIKGTGGYSNGPIPFLKCFDAVSCAVDQGGGKRPGAFAVYIEPWHSNVYEILSAKLPTGNAKDRAEHLFYALWTPDIFMERVQSNGKWSLFSPHQVPNLLNCHGKEFTDAYLQYESEGIATSVVDAIDLYNHIIRIQIETGMPFMLYKDTINRLSNQKNLGTISQSNLCVEIVEYTDSNEIAMCNLCTVSLPAMLTLNGSVLTEQLIEQFHSKLYETVKKVTVILNKTIDNTFYPISQGKLSNLRHRPIGIGVQGLADLFAIIGVPFCSDEAKKLNRELFETMSFAFWTASMEMAKERTELLQQYLATPNKTLYQLLYPKSLYEMSMGEYNDTVDPITKVRKSPLCYGPCIRSGIEAIAEQEMRLAKDNVEYAGAYHTFKGSPVSEGLFQHDLHSLYNNGVNYTSGRHDWDTLRANVMRYGTRNSLGLCCQPTASTAQILGNNECIEPYVTNIYNRKVISGTFQIVNKHLIRDLTAMGLWNTNMKNALIASRGSVQTIMEIPKDIRDRYLTVWEIKQRELIQMSADRGRFIDQSQSLNLFLANPTPEQLRAMHLHSWKSGLKTGMYYLRSQPATHAQQFTVAVASKHETPKQEATVYTDEEKLICSRDNKEACLACS